MGRFVPLCARLFAELGGDGGLGFEIIVGEGIIARAACGPECA